MIATALSDAALLIAALGAFITSATGAVISIRTHKEVKTMNGLTMAQLADAGETRRIDAIVPSERTKGEDEHLEVMHDDKDRL